MSVTSTSHTIYIYIYVCMGTAVAQWLRCCAMNRKVVGSIQAGVSGFFINSASNRNEYQECFLGVKAAGA